MKTSNKSPQETVSDVVFPEWGSSKNCGKDKMVRCLAAFLVSLRGTIALQHKVGSSDFRKEPGKTRDTAGY